MVWNDLHVRVNSETGNIGPGAAAVSTVPRVGQTSSPGDIRSSLGADRGVLVPGPLMSDQPVRNLAHTTYQANPSPPRPPPTRCHGATAHLFRSPAGCRGTSGPLTVKTPDLLTPEQGTVLSMPSVQICSLAEGCRSFQQ